MSASGSSAANRRSPSHPGPPWRTACARSRRRAPATRCSCARRTAVCVGVLTERDVFAQLVDGDIDLSQPVEALMTLDPRTLDLDQTIREAIVLMQTGPLPECARRGRGRPARRRRPPVGRHQVSRRVVPRGTAQPAPATPPANEGARRRVTMTKPLEPRRPGARASHHPVRRRFRRRDAVDRDPVHPDRRRLRERHQHPAGLPGRDPGPGRVAARAFPGSRSASRHRRSTRRVTSPTSSWR